MNNDLYSDTYVHSRLTKQKEMQRKLTIVACILLPVIGAVIFKNLIAFLVGVVIDIILIYYLPNKIVDYEYVFVDGQIDFDRIIANNARKNMLRTDLEKTDIIAPEGSHSLDAYKNVKVQDFSSGNPEDKHYILMAKGEKGEIKVRFTPTEHLLEQMKMKARSKIEC